MKPEKKTNNFLLWYSRFHNCLWNQTRNPNANLYKFIVWEFQQVVYLIFHRSKSFFEYRILRHFWQYEYQSRKSYCHRFFRCCLFFSNYHFNFQVKQHYCRTRRTILQKYWSGCLKCETWFYLPKLNFPYSKLLADIHRFWMLER